ncbi:hypothetical protein GCM10018963_70660 [Saccharothrix longispora]
MTPVPPHPVASSAAAAAAPMTLSSFDMPGPYGRARPAAGPVHLKAQCRYLVRTTLDGVPANAAQPASAERSGG